MRDSLDPVLSAQVLDLIAVEAEASGRLGFDASGLGNRVGQELPLEVLDSPGE